MPGACRPSTPNMLEAGFDPRADVFNRLLQEPGHHARRRRRRRHRQPDLRPAAVPRGRGRHDQDIWLYINSPGGSVTAGMAIYDTMQFVGCDVATVCLGLAASMGQFLLTAGAAGKRFTLPNARIMMHQPLAGLRGQASDIAIQAEQHAYTKRRMAELIAQHSGKTLEQIQKDSERDRWFTAEAGPEYGLCDKVIVRRGEIALVTTPLTRLARRGGRRSAPRSPAGRGHDRGHRAEVDAAVAQQPVVRRRPTTAPSRRPGGGPLHRLRVVGLDRAGRLEVRAPARPSPARWPAGRPRRSGGRGRRSRRFVAGLRQGEQRRRVVLDLAAERLGVARPVVAAPDRAHRQSGEHGEGDAEHGGGVWQPAARRGPRLDRSIHECAFISALAAIRRAGPHERTAGRPHPAGLREGRELMSDLSRRDLLRASAGAAVVAVPMAAIGSSAVAAAAARYEGALAAASEPAVAADGPVMFCVHDARRGEVSILHGTDEVVVRDRQLVDRILHAASAATELRRNRHVIPS